MSSLKVYKNKFMLTREEIKKNLYRGDGIRIATKCRAFGLDAKEQYVNKILRQARKAKFGKIALKVWEIAEQVAIENIRDKQAASQIQ